MAKKIIIHTYPQLLRQVKGELKQLEFQIKHLLVASYWRIGRDICEHVSANKQRADYGARITERLSKDTGISNTNLKKMMQFYRAYPIRPNSGELGWSHFVELLPVKDKDKRNQLQRQAVEKGWTVLELRAKVIAFRRAKSGSGQKTNQTPLKFTRGELYLYRIGARRAGNPKELYIDCGFKVRKIFPEAKDFSLKANDIVTIIPPKHSTKNSDCFDLKLVKDKRIIERMYTYKASLDKMLDADTFDVAIDHGFGTDTVRRLRLRGINAPELGTPEGERAKRFVERRLKPLDFFIVKTFKDAKGVFNRYIADVFYLPGAKDPATVVREGRFLNQELLDAGLAEKI